MAQITVVAKAKAKPGSEKELQRALEAVVAPTRQEKGCLSYVLHQGAEDPALFVFIEQWESREALKEHFNKPYVQALFMNLPALIAGAPEILTLSEVS